MGSTETNAVVQHTTDREDWSYICINPIFNGIEMRPTSDLFELVYVKDPLYADYQGVFKAYPHLNEFSMQDLYSRHPRKPNLWKHEGRKDHTIVFQNGWKFNPMVHERLIELHPAVNHAIVVGTGRDRPAVIIELLPKFIFEDITDQNPMLKEIWPQILQANNVVETYSQLERRYIIFASRSKPFKIGPDGAVQRKSTINMYAREVDDLYASVTTGGLKGLFRTEGASA